MSTEDKNENKEPENKEPEYVDPEAAIKAMRTSDSNQESNEQDPGTPIENNSTDPEIERAMNDGWVPVEQWEEQGKDPALHRSAREFNDRGELMRHIQRSNDRVATLTKAVQKFQELNKNIVERDKEELTAQIKAELAAKIEEGDGKAAVELTDKLAEVNAMPTVEDEQVGNEPAPEFNEFISKNTWYTPADQRENPGAGKDVNMSVIADAFGETFVKEKYFGEGIEPTPQEIVEHVEQRLQERFPQRFGGQQTNTTQKREVREPGTLETNGDTNSANTPKSKGSKVSMKDLNDETRAMVREMSDGADYSEQEYIDMMVETGALVVEK